MEPDCIFCKIVAGTIPSEQVYQDEDVTAFRDINPAAPVHVLLVPNRHIASLREMAPEDEPLVGRLFYLARQIAEAQGIADAGYRLIVNTGDDGGQVVYHLHVHLLGGAPMRHPLG